jgi:UDP-N-acetyl-D-galactosamine dehydrogenase
LAAAINVAEAAKVIENTQRDVNIALMNELSIIFHTLEVLRAAGTKWILGVIRVGKAFIPASLKLRRTQEGAKVLILGLTFKENVGDIRNTKVVDIVSELAEYDVESMIFDPYADAEEVHHEYGLEIYPQEVGYAQPPQDRGGWASRHSKSCRWSMRWCWRCRMTSSKN